MNLLKFVSDAIKAKLKSLPELSGADFGAVSVEIPKNTEFGDFSTNAAMILARPLGKSPRDIAEIISPALAEIDFVSNVSIAGPGFLNIKLRDEFIAKSANEFEFAKDDNPIVIDMDYGAYNVAKSLHVGHLRTSIVGDTLNRVAKVLGHKTISYNHIGDWGRPMGLVIAYIESLHPDWPFFKSDFNPDADLSSFHIDAKHLDTYYPLAAARAKSDTDFLDHARDIAAKLQDGNLGYTALYNIFMPVSLASMSDIVNRLNIIPFDEVLGERNAAKYLPQVEKILRDKNLLEQSDGAEIVRVARAQDNEPMPPFMFSNSRGGDTYDATDLAAIYYRKITDAPDKIWYLTDARQKLHFTQVFRAADMSGIYKAENFEHLWFGTINGPGGIPFKTRDGNAAGLSDVIQIVHDAAAARISESGKKLPDDTTDKIALAALKFNDLMHDVKSDYIFDPDVVTQFEGRTGPYILYTAVRLQSILKKAERNPDKAGKINNTLAKSERDMLIKLLDFNHIVQKTFDLRATDVLANYAYDLAQLINVFYHTCPILREDEKANVRNHRLNLTAFAVKILSKSLDLMGLQIPDEM